jgi:hypothetical protein
MHISDKKQKQLSKEFEKVERKMGEGVHEKHHHLVEEVEELEKIYLKDEGE